MGQEDRACPRLSGDVGANLVEYVLLVSFIMLVALSAATYFGRNATSKFSSVCSSVGNAGNTGANPQCA
ncbi:MAG: hypothetical protein U0Q07_09250 [Acidimicrobiales bacterium]